ncbi:MAG TPA: protein kinase [Pyrinomonadaceae bacterium]|jgi:serine/threonine protein kinase/tetratricopeptide (TPR) repeat protein
MSLVPGTKLGRYEIRSKIGEGGMGEVYLAVDTKLDRKVALKILPADVASDPGRMHRFVQEARSASGLNHPNIITIYEIDETESGHFIAMEFVEGETLRERMERAPLKLNEAVDVAIRAAGALSAAHDAGIIHRDIKPDNIMIRTDGIVKVLDFGLAKLVERLPTEYVDTEAPTSVPLKSEPGTVIGTAVYMSPEQARGVPVDARTDIFSFGVVLYEMVTGSQPFKGSDTIEILAAILSDREPPPIARYEPDAPPELERIVEKALAKERDERYQSAKDLLIDLRHLKKRLDLDAELKRSKPAEKLQGVRTREIASAPKTALVDSAPPRSAGPSSAEYVINQVKSHKLAAAITLGVLALAVVLFLIWFFKPTRTAPLTEKDTIVLADFVNTTGDPVFDGTLKQALAVQLEQSPFLNIFSDQRVRETLRFMNRSPEERVTKEIAREICARQQLKAFLTGSISTLGSHYVLTLEASNAQTGDTIALQQAEAESKEQVLSALGSAATKLREQLGESLASVQKYDAPIYQATTSSLDALKIFSMGVEKQLNGKYLDAIPLFKRATEIDPNFARAYAAMSSMYYNTRQYDLAADASRKAYDLRDRVGEYEKFYITQVYYDNVTGELDKYLETLELWKRTYPRDSAPHNNLAVKYTELRQFDKGLEEAREAIRLNPNSASGHSILATCFVGLNRFDEAKEIIRKALSQNLENLTMHQNLYRMAFLQGDAAAMKQEVDWVSGKPEEYAAQTWQGDGAAFSGELRKAKEFSTNAFELAQRRDLKEVASQLAAAAALRDAQFGDCGKVKEQAAKALDLSHDRVTLSLAANALAICGDSGQTKSILDELVKRFPTDTLLNQQRIPLIQAHVELQRGNPTQTLQLLEATRPHGSYLLFPIAYLRGQAFLSLKKGNEAAAEFQTIVDHRGWSALSYFYPLAQLGLARAAVLQGDTSTARKAYQDFFATWKDADADLSVLIDARKEYEKLK